MSFYDRLRPRTADTGRAAAPDSSPAARRLLLGAVSSVGRGHSRVRASDDVR